MHSIKRRSLPLPNPSCQSTQQSPCDSHTVDQAISLLHHANLRRTRWSQRCWRACSAAGPCSAAAPKQALLALPLLPARSRPPATPASRGCCCHQDRRAHPPPPPRRGCCPRLPALRATWATLTWRAGPHLSPATSASTAPCQHALLPSQGAASCAANVLTCSDLCLTARWQLGWRRTCTFHRSACCRPPGRPPICPSRAVVPRPPAPQRCPTAPGTLQSACPSPGRPACITVCAPDLAILQMAHCSQTRPATTESLLWLDGFTHGRSRHALQ